jgi:hypothetical protein
MKRHFPIILILLLACIGIFTGIRWGLPSSQYRQFYYSNEKQLDMLMAGVSDDYVKNSWSISKGAGVAEKLPRSIFNIIRPFHPDEQNILKSISNMKPEKFDFNPHFFEYPTLYIYLVALVLKLLSVFNFIVVTGDIRYYFANPDRIADMYLAGRILTASLGVAGIFLLYRAGQFLTGHRTGLFAALFLAITPLYVLNAHYMTVDIPMLFFIILAIHFLSRLMHSRNSAWLYCAAIAMGCAAGSKYPALFLCLLVPVSGLNIFPRKDIRTWKVLIFSTFLCIAVFFATSPYILLSFVEFKRDFLYQASARGIGGFSNYFYLQWVNLKAALCSGAGTLIFIFLAGVVFLSVRRARSNLLILSGLILAAIPILIAGGAKYARYYLILLPFLCLAGGAFMEFVVSLKNRMKGVVIAVGAILCGLSLAQSVANSLLMCRQDVRISAAYYISEHVPKGSTIVFTADPWIFQVPPVNPFEYSVRVCSEDNLSRIDGPAYLVYGELQYFLTYGDRGEVERSISEFFKRKGFFEWAEFRNEPFMNRCQFCFDDRNICHDMLYTHPSIHVARKVR